MDTTKVGIQAAKLMDEIAKKYEDGPCVVGEVMLVVEVKVDPEADMEEFEGSDFEDFAAVIETRSTDDRVWAQLGLLSAASESLKARFTLVDED